MTKNSSTNYWMNRVATDKREARREQMSRTTFGIGLLVVMLAGLAWAWNPFLRFGLVMFTYPEAIIMALVLSFIVVGVVRAGWRAGR